MLYSLGHGQRIAIGGKARGKKRADVAYGDQVYKGAKVREWVTPDGEPTPAPHPYYPPVDDEPLAPREVFRYLFKDAAPAPILDDAAAKLDALADAMAEATLDQKDAEHESNIPPIMTYLGQFIDHDITANTDREDPNDEFNIDKTAITPASRDDVEQFKGNLRKGTLALDSVYGDGPGQDETVMKLERALRDPADPAKMRLGSVAPISAQFGFERPPLPVDEGADIPRIGLLIDQDGMSLQEVRDIFNDPDSEEDDLKRKPLIGDMRNDENLIVAQTHLSFLRFHNACVDALRAGGFVGDDEALFKEARKNVTWIYQWLVAHVWLKSVCDPDIVDQVINDKAPVYQAFFNKHAGVMGGARPMPLEFSVAAYRFGHSMVRADYDYNRNFGRSPGNDDRRATFRELFLFTSGGGLRPNEGFDKQPVLPDNWIIEWDRFVSDGGLTNRVARKIDTQLALQLKDMTNEDGTTISGIMAHLAARNLRRGYVFNLPDAQTLIAAMNAAGASVGEPMKADVIASGPTRDAVLAGGFDSATPLWFYLLKEAEETPDANGDKGNQLGPLGSRIVAETLIGLLVTDPDSFMNAAGGWSPADGVQPNGTPVDSFSKMLHAAGVMSSGVGV